MRSPVPAPRPRRDHGFRWRGTEVTRLEGFSDAVFGFAVTLLVISLEVPRTFAELSTLMRDIPAFAGSFSLLVLIWHAQHVFFRRYALDDRTTFVLNVALLFVVLVYVYPLKFLFSALIGLFRGEYTIPASDGLGAVPIVSRADWPTLMVIYGIGFVAVFVLFALMYLHALRQRTELELTPFEGYLTRQSVRENLIMASFGVLSIVIALAGHPAIAGWSYVLIGPVQAWAAMRHARTAPDGPRALAALEQAPPASPG